MNKLNIALLSFFYLFFSRIHAQPILNNAVFPIIGDSFYIWLILKINYLMKKLALTTILFVFFALNGNAQTKKFSVGINLTENTICYIEITAIVYKNNLPIDYYEYVMFPNSEYGNEDLGYGPIKPFLGKSITLENHTSWNIRCRSKNDFLFNKNMDEKVVFRILNYTIIKD